MPLSGMYENKGIVAVTKKLALHLWVKYFPNIKKS